MPQKFFGKNITRRIMRPSHPQPMVYKMSDYVEVVHVQSEKTKENKEKKETTKEMNNQSLNNIEELLGNGQSAPKRRTKLEKKEKGLYEREEKATVLITEDNKMVLND